MGKNNLKDLKLKKVGSEEKSYNDKLHSNKDTDISDKKADKLKKSSSKKRMFVGFACISSIVVFFAIIIAGAFVAWDYGWKGSEENSMSYRTGLTLPEAVKLLSDLYKDGSGVVTNPYDQEKDLESFYTDLKKGLYLSQECDISVQDIVSGLLADLLNNNDESGENGEDGEEQTLSSGGQLIMSEEEAPVIGNNGSITGNETLDKLLESLEFDFSVLEGKDQDTLEKEMLELSDKELAAVLNASLSQLTEIDALKKIETDYGLNIAGVLSVQQVIIDEATVTEQKDVRLLVTMKLNLRDAAKTVFENKKEEISAKIFGDSNISADIKNFIRDMIGEIPEIFPKTLYFTASVYPNKSTWEANAYINNVKDEHQQLLNTLLNSLLGTKDDNGEEISFMQSLNQKVCDTIAEIEKLIPVNFTPSGSFETKPIQAVINMLGAENLTQGDFLALIRDVKLPTPESLGVDGYTEEAQTIAATAFINGEFSTKYYFNNVVNAETDEYYITANNLFSRLNTFSEDEETLKRIEIRDKIVAGLDYADGGDFRPFADEDTLAALLNGYLKNQAYKVENMEPWIMDVVCKATGSDDVKGNYFTLEITIELDLTGNIDAQLKDNESMKKLVKQLLPDSIYVFLTYTQYEGTDENPSVAIVDINKKGNEMSRQHFETLMSLLDAVKRKNGSSEGGDPTDQVAGMTFDELEAQLNQKIYEAFTDIENNLGAKIEFVPASGSANGGANLPNIFEVLAGNEKLKYDPEVDTGYESEEEFNAKNKISGEEMYLILSQTYKYDPDEDDSDVKTNIDESVEAEGVENFVSQIDAKYYIDTDEEGEDWSAANIQNMLSVVSGEYDTRLRMNSADGKSGLLDDETSYGDLYPYLSQYELANIVNASGRLNNMMQIMPSGKIRYIYIYIDKNTNMPKIRMRINGKISFDNVTGEGAETVAQNKKYETLFPYDIDMIVDVSVLYDEYGNPEYDAKVDINDIGDGYLDKMLFFVRRFSGQTSLGEGEEKKDFTKEGLELTIESKLTAAFNDMNADGNVETKFVEKDATEGGMQFSTVFELAINKIYTEADDVKPEGQEMRSTIKGLHAGLSKYTLANGNYKSPINEGSEGGENSTFAITPSSDGTSITINAQFLDAYMNTKMTGDKFNGIVGGNAEDISFYQSYILPRYDNGTSIENAQAEAIKAYYNYGLSDSDVRINSDISYLLVTLEVSTDNLFTAQGSSGKNNNLVPDKIYVNAIIALLEDSAADSQSQTQIFVNRMTDKECQIMNRILKSAGYEKDLFGSETDEYGKTSTERMIEQIFGTELVNYKYNYNINVPGLGQKTGTYDVVITVEQVVDSSFVWFCSLYDEISSPDKDDRKQYIKDEVSYLDSTDREVEKIFGASGTDARYGIAYLRYEKSIDLADYIINLV